MPLLDTFHSNSRQERVNNREVFCNLCNAKKTDLPACLSKFGEPDQVLANPRIVVHMSGLAHELDGLHLQQTIVA
jgi:hypothetical protein